MRPLVACCEANMHSEGPADRLLPRARPGAPPQLRKASPHALQNQTLMLQDDHSGSLVAAPGGAHGHLDHNLLLDP